MPAKADIDPVDIGWALSRIFLADYSAEEGFTYRLAGAEIAKVLGKTNLKGSNLRDVVNPERLEQVEQSWLRAVEERAVIRMAGMVYYGADRTAMGERLLLPLAEQANGPVTGLLGMTVCRWTDGPSATEIEAPTVEALPVGDIP